MLLLAGPDPLPTQESCGSPLRELQGRIQGFGIWDKPSWQGVKGSDVSESSSAGSAMAKLCCRNPGSCSGPCWAGLALCPGRRDEQGWAGDFLCSCVRLRDSDLLPACSPAAFPGIGHLGNGDVLQPCASSPG